MLELIPPAFINALAGLLVALLSTAVYQINVYVRRRLGAKEAAPTYRQTIEQLTKDLVTTSSKVDDLLQDITRATQERQSALLALEQKLSTLTSEEKELQTRIDDLQNVTLPAVKYFLKETEKGERRSAKRDYFLFLAGVIVSLIISLILQSLFGAA